MANVKIVIPSSFISAMSQLTQNIQRFSAIADQLVKSTQLQSAVPKLRASQVAINSVTGRLHRLNQVLLKIEERLTSSIGKFINMMGSAARGFLTALSWASSILGPIISGIVTVATWTFKIGMTITSYAISFGRWLWDKIVGLGDSMLQDYLASSGVLSSISGLRSFRASFGQVIPGLDSSTLGKLAIAQTSMESPQFGALTYLGMNTQGDTADLAAKAIVVVQRMMKTFPTGLEFKMAYASGFLSFLNSETVLALRTMSTVELRELVVYYTRLREVTKLSTETEIKWIGFSLSLARTRAAIETVIARRLAEPGFVNSLTELSKSFVHLIDIFVKIPVTQSLIDRISGAINDFAGIIDKPETRGWFHTLIEQLGQLTLAFLDAAEWLARLAERLNRKEYNDYKRFERLKRNMRRGGRWVTDSSGRTRWVPGHIPGDPRSVDESRTISSIRGPRGPRGGGGGGDDTGPAKPALDDSTTEQRGTDLYNKLLERYKHSSVVGTVPSWGPQFGIKTGSAEEWARFGVSVAHKESRFNPRADGPSSDPGGSHGVFQYGHTQVPGGNAYNVDASVNQFVTDSEKSAKSDLPGSILARRFATIGLHPERGNEYIRSGDADRIARRAGSTTLAPVSPKSYTPVPPTYTPVSPVPRGTGKGLVAPVSGTFGTSGGHGYYGATRQVYVGHGSRAHSGVDWGAPTGSSAYAITGGTVLYRGTNTGYNANIVIKGDDGTIRRYATHGSTIDIPIGGRVEQGQVIGTIAQGHLHYETIPQTINGNRNPVWDEMVSHPGQFVSTSRQRGTVDPALEFGLPYGARVSGGRAIGSTGSETVTPTPPTPQTTAPNVPAATSSVPAKRISVPAGTYAGGIPKGVSSTEAPVGIAGYEAAPVGQGARLSPAGNPPSAVIIHHTSSVSDPKNIVSGWQSGGKGIGAQYIVDRYGVVHDVKAEYGYSGTDNISTDALTDQAKKSGIQNANIVGIEVIAKDDKDVTPAQVAAVKKFIAKNYSETPVYGHGEVNPGHKEADEGMTIVKGIRSDRAKVESQPPQVPSGTPAATAVNATPVPASGPRPTVGPLPNQSDRPYWFTGTISMDGNEYHYGTGGAHRGSIPYGTYQITPGTIGPWGQAHGAIGIAGNKIWDPKLKSWRDGIEIHGWPEEIDRLHSDGCIAVQDREYPAFKAALMAKIRKEGPQYITVAPGGHITIGSKPPANATPVPNAAANNPAPVKPEEKPTGTTTTPASSPPQLSTAPTPNKKDEISPEKPKDKTASVEPEHKKNTPIRKIRVVNNSSKDIGQSKNNSGTIQDDVSSVLPAVA